MDVDDTAEPPEPKNPVPPHLHFKKNPGSIVADNGTPISILKPVSPPH